VGTKQLDTFMAVHQLVKEYYVDKLPDGSKMSHGAVRAMLATLNDPNSRFLEPAERAALDSEARGRFAGIGAALAIVPQKRDGYTEYKITVVAPMPGSPAEKADLRPGDVITGVDGKWVLGSDPFLQANRVIKRYQVRDADEDEVTKAIEAAEARVRGGIGLGGAQKKLTMGEGEKRTLSVQRLGAKDPLKVELTTAATQVDPLVAKTLPGGVAYVKINAFTEDSGTRFKEALAGLPKQPGLLLDLRGNPGGLLDPAKSIAAQLTRGGTVAVAVGPGKRRSTISVPASNGAAPPVIVLVDKGTASTAEMLAATLKDKGVGTLVGSRTFGDALAQTLYPLPDGSAFTLTTGKILSPTGTDWQRVGLAPGVAVAGGTPEEQVIAKAVSVLRDRAHVASAGRGR
jgi:carboxyl-terminal processing protease